MTSNGRGMGGLSLAARCADDRKAEGAGGVGELAVVGGERRRNVLCGAVSQRRRQVDCVERPNRCCQRLCGTSEKIWRQVEDRGTGEDLGDEARRRNQLVAVKMTAEPIAIECAGA